MSLFIETIKCRDGQIFNLPFHQARFSKVQKEWYGLAKTMDLKKIITVPSHCQTGLFRCRILFSDKIEKIEFLPHTYRKIESLKLINDDLISYQYKSTDRKHLEKLFENRGEFDDILIVNNGFITDSFTANVIFFDGLKWWTPDRPLLAGTQRARLIKEGELSVCKITPDNLYNFQKAGLINALQDFENMPVIDMENISY